MTPLHLDRDALLRTQRNRAPFLMMDEATAVIAGESARGFKQLSPSEWFFECHFPGDPTMPGMLQLEAIVQMTALTILCLPGNAGKVAYIVAVKDVRFRRKVLPGDRLDLEGQLLSWKRGVGACKGRAAVNGETACEAEFTLVLPDELTPMASRR